MMNNKLLQQCDLFYKAAQQSHKKEQKIVLDPKKKNINFWSKFLYNAIKSYALKFSSPKIAKDVFDSITMHNKAPAYGRDKDLKEVNAISGAISEASRKLTEAGVNPINALAQRGMANINPNILNILQNNLQTLREAKDFTKYQHYYLQAPGEAKEVIEIDDYSSESNPGY